jgi:GNAT superfamily N-acetyltransferase
MVLVVGAEVVGFASGYMRHTVAASQPVAFLDEIVIKTELRGRKLGSRLMAAFEEWASNRNCKFAVLATGGARGFYEGLGYSTRAGYYKKPLNVTER